MSSRLIMRKSVKALLSIVLLAAAPCLCWTQSATQTTKPDLSGEWVLERGSGDGSRLLVEHREPEVRIKRLKGRSGNEVFRESVYYTDGRGEVNEGPTITDRPEKPAREDEVRTKTEWRGDRVVTRGSIQKFLSGRPLNAEVSEEWKLSKDGRKLTHTTRFRFDGADASAQFGRVPPGGAVISTGPSEFKAVYKRASP